MIVRKQQGNVFKAGGWEKIFVSMFLTCPSDPAEQNRKLKENKYLFKKVSDSQDVVAEIVGWLFCGFFFFLINKLLTIFALKL